MNADERRGIIRALRELGEREWAHLIKYHEDQLKAEGKKKR